MRLRDLLNKVMDGDMTPREVLVYIDRLPSDSAFAEASANDDEIAAMYASQEPTEVRPRIREWTPERAELVRVVEALERLTALVHNAVSDQRIDQPRPHPRPETALERFKARVDDASYEYLMGQIAEAQARS